MAKPQARSQDRTDPAQTRGGTADGPRKPPKAENENREEKLLQDELDDSFPASDPPAITQPTAPEPPAPKKPRPA